MPETFASSQIDKTGVTAIRVSQPGPEINWIVTLVMVLLHLGALAALFVCSWKSLAVAVLGALGFLHIRGLYSDMPSICDACKTA